MKKLWKKLLAVTTVVMMAITLLPAMANANATDEKGTVRVNNFSYSGTAARLLTAQEVNRACGITVGSYKTGELDNCKYLMENTKYTNNSLLYGKSD